MARLIKVLSKTIVGKFYERNVGLLFFVFFIMFGVVESNQLISYHQALIYGTLTSPIFLLLVCGIWLLYLIKCLHFFVGQLTKPENTFLIELAKLNRLTRFGVVAILLLLVYEPVLIYSFFILMIGIHSKLFVATAMVVLFHLSGLTLVSLLVAFQINHPHQELKLIRIPQIHWPWPKPFFSFYINHLTSQLPTALLFSKLFSLIALYGFFQISVDDYDNRLALLGLLFGLVAHSVIVFELRKFEEISLLFLRNLPIENWKRFTNLSIVYALLLSPELIMLLVNHIKIIDAIGSILLGTGFLLLLHNKLYSKLNNDKHLQWVLGLFLASFMLVLSKIFWAGVVMLWLISYRYFIKEFYEFELNLE